MSTPARRPTRARGTRRPAPAGPDAVDSRGTELELEVGPVAHGGHCVARHEGRVVFVRHALPGERVVARVTEGAEGASFWRADAVRVLAADADRVEPPCPVAGPGLCGGCDFQHATPARQRTLKAAVVSEQFRRLAGLDVDVTVEEAPLPGADGDGLRWRTRTQFAVDAEGRTGLRAHRSHQVVPLQDCPISTEAVVGSGVLGARFGNVGTVEVAAGSDGAAPLVVVEPLPGTHAHVPKLPDASVAVRTPEGLHRVSGRTWVGERVTVRVGEQERQHAFRVGEPASGRSTPPPRGCSGRPSWRLWHRSRASTRSTCTPASGCSRPCSPTPWAPTGPSWPWRARNGPCATRAGRCTSTRRWSCGRVPSRRR